MNIALEFGKPKICCTTIVYKVDAWASYWSIVYKVDAWASYWSIDSGCGIAPKNSIEFFVRDYGF